MTPPGPLRQLHDLDRTSPQFHKQLSNHLRGDEYQNVIPSLQGEDLVWLIEYLDSVLGDISDPPSLEFKGFLHGLEDICGIKGMLPRSCMLSDSLLGVSLPSAPGSTLDRSRLRIKRVRIHPNGHLRKVKQAFHEVAVVWKHLAHPNIAPLLGVTTDPLQLISDRISGRNLMEYIASHPDANKVTLLSDIAEGLNYLHSCDVIHGGLRGSSILVDDTGHAQITDIGLAMVTQNLDLIRDASAEHEDSTRWIAPEILDDRGIYSKEADTFAFAMVTIEAFTGAVPFGDRSPYEVMVAIVGGERPPRPTDRTLTDRLWELIQQCWNQEAHLRPQALQILRAFEIPVWKPLINCPLTMDERISLITAIFSDRKETEAVKRLRGGDTQSFVDVIDEALGTLVPWLRRKCLTALCKICGREALLPRSVQIPLCYNRMDTPLYRGGYGEVWKGEHQGREVAVKVLVAYRTSNLDKITRRFCKEVMTWKALRHPNVLPLLGVTMSNNQFTMVSEWMFNGNINEFIKAHRDVNRFELLKDVALGLIYMHGEGMIHGDLKGANILVDQYGHACLADFGLSAIVLDPAYPTTLSSSVSAGTTRWSSPERLDPNQFGLKDSRPTKESDCYALGMTIFEVLSGQAPFSRGCNNFVVMRKVIDGERPGRPSEAEGAWFTDDLWETLELCWSPQPGDRPAIEAVFECLKQVLTAWRPLPPRVDGDMETDTDYESSFAISSPASGSQVPPSPQLLVVSLTAGSLTRRSNIITAESTGVSRPSPPPRLAPSQPPEELDIEETAQTVNRGPLNYPEEHPYLHVGYPLPTQDPVRRAIGRAGAELSGGDTGDMPTTLAKRRRLFNEDTSRAIFMEGTVHQDRESRQKTDQALNTVSVLDGLTAATDGFPHPPSLRAKAMPMEAKSSLIGGLPALTAQLDALCADQNPGDLSSALRTAFAERELYTMYLSFLAADEGRAKALLEVFDKALTATQHDVKIFKKFRQLCGRAGLLPASHIIPEGLIRTTENPIAFGGFGDVWEGIYDDKRVAIKALRVYKHGDVRKFRKVFYKEVVMWRRIAHPNIVPFLGVSEAHAPLSMVSEWMPNGNVRGYVRKNPETSRLQLLLDISRGLSFLHSLEIVHGDLKGDNILVDESGCARLSDFGFACITGFKGTYRWMAPELLSIGQSAGRSGIPTRQSDIFALGMVTFEVFTGQVPFPENKQPAAMKKIMDGERPLRPQKTTRLGLSDEFWEVIQSSWAHGMEQRPPVETFVEFLEKATPNIAVLEELTEFDATSTEHVQKFSYMFEYGDNTLLGMREDETLTLIEVFDRVLNSSLNDGQLRSRCLRGLQKVSARCGLLPKSYWIPSSSLVQQDGASSAAARRVSKPIDGRLVVVKTISPDSVDNFNSFKRRLYTDAVMWKRLRHPNVASFLGFRSDSPFSLVYLWVSDGNLSDYLCENPDVDKLGLLLGVARGLTYLHQYDLVHGNLTGGNILVDSDGAACISEYGLELVLRDEVSSESIPINVRWTAPEILSTENADKRVASVDDGKFADVYSFGMVMFEILTGAIPFANESDEEIVGRVTTGHRPEWPSNNPSQELVDALREQVDACWSHGPEQRPTALVVQQSLQALGRERLSEPQESQERADDGTWNCVGDNLEPGRKEHSILFSNTLVNTSIILSHHGESSTSKYDPPKSRRTGVGGRMRRLLQWSKSGSTTAEIAEGCTLETAIVDQREGIVHITGGNVAYLTSKPIPNGKKLKEVVIAVVSKDQGWSSYAEDHGTYRNSWTWFELSVGSPSKDSGEKWRGEVVRNLHAHGEFKEHTIKISDRKLYKKAESGDVLTVWAHAQFPGWKNTVKTVTMRCVVE